MNTDITHEVEQYRNIIRRLLFRKPQTLVENWKRGDRRKWTAKPQYQTVESVITEEQIIRNVKLILRSKFYKHLKNKITPSIVLQEFRMSYAHYCFKFKKNVDNN